MSDPYLEQMLDDTEEDEGSLFENPKPVRQLEAVVTVAVTVAVAPAPASLDPLAALLARTTKRMEDDKALKESRKALTDSRLTGRAREEVEQGIRQIELTRDWKARATVAMYQTQVCAHCDSINSVFSGLFQREVHKVNRATRWVQVNSVQDLLPKETKETKTVTPMCFDCATEDFGFTLRETVEPIELTIPKPLPPSVLNSQLDKPEDCHE